MAEQDVLTEKVNKEDIQRFEQEYYEELKNNRLTPETQFNYAWCLVRSEYPTDIKKGIQGVLLLEELFAQNPEGRRDYLYYLAIGNARVKEYSQALKYTKDFLEVEPNNTQVRTLEDSIKKQMTREGLKGAALAGGVAVGIAAGLVGLGFALASKK